MARIVGRQRIREGRSLGERLSEVVVYILIIGALVWGVRWYFVVYLHSPKVVLGKYLGYVKAGDVKAQYPLLAASTKALFPSEKDYNDKWPPSHDLAGRLAAWEIKTVRESGDTAEITCVLRIRRPGQELYQAASDPYNDRYTLVKESDGWKVALEKSAMESVNAAQSRR